LTDHTTAWKLANFVLLAGGLGYLIYKKGGPFFHARSEQIRKGIAEAAKFKEEAQARYAQIEQRLAGLTAEIEHLRKTAREESGAEGERVRLETERNLKKIQAQAEQEMASAVKAARQELRAYSAELAIRLAEQSIRGRITAEIEDQLVASTIAELELCQKQ
jgi:F-type H+-transporting ATPase subunit b